MNAGRACTLCGKPAKFKCVIAANWSLAGPGHVTYLPLDLRPGTL